MITVLRSYLRVQPRRNLIEQVRVLCLALPETFELETWDHPTFRVGGGRGKIFCTAAPDGSTITLKADPVEREAVLAQEEIAELIATSYCLVAPQRLAAQVTSPPSPEG